MRRRQAVVAATEPTEDRPLPFPRDQEGRVPAALERWIRQRDARFGLCTYNGSSPPVAFGKCCRPRKQRGCMAIRSQSESYLHGIHVYMY